MPPTCASGFRLLDTQIIESHGKEESLLAQIFHTLATSEKTFLWLLGTLEDWTTESLEAAMLLCIVSLDCGNY
jgi:hypothetical protein